MKTICIAGSDSWQRRAVEKTGGNESLLGCFVLAILAWQNGRKPPRFGKLARIDKDGILHSNMQDKDGKVHWDYALGPVKHVIHNFRFLADELKLNDDERKEMFSELKKWVYKDDRSTSIL